MVLGKTQIYELTTLNWAAASHELAHLHTISKALAKMSLPSVSTINCLICVLKLRVAFIPLPIHLQPATTRVILSTQLPWDIHPAMPLSPINPEPPLPPLPFVSIATNAGDSPALLAEAVLADSAHRLMEGASEEINRGRGGDLQRLASFCSFLGPCVLEAKWILIWIMYSDNLCWFWFNHRSG